MSRTAISISQITASQVSGAGTAKGILRTSPSTTFDQTNGHSVASAFGAIPLGEQLFFEIANTHTSDHVITVKAGSSTYGNAVALGDYTQTVPAGTTRTIGPVSLARHAQDASATVYVDADSGMTGTIIATLRAAATDPRMDTAGLAYV